MYIRFFMSLMDIPRAPEDGGGGANSGAAAVAGAASSPVQGQAAVAASGTTEAAGGGTTSEASTGTGGAATANAGATTTEAPKLFRVDGLADHLYGANDQETITKLAKAYDGARLAISQKGEVPADVAGYAFDASEKVKPFADSLNTDPIWSATKDVALKHGLTKTQYQGFINEMMEVMIEKTGVLEPFSAEKELAALFPEITDPAQRSKAGADLSQQNIALVKAWAEQDLPEAASTLLLSQMDRAGGNKLVDWIRQMRREERPALTGGSGAGGGISDADLNARLADPRNIVGNAKYEPGYAAETTAMFKRRFGE